jgi:hypothetical protein
MAQRYGYSQLAHISENTRFYKIGVYPSLTMMENCLSSSTRQTLVML